MQILTAADCPLDPIIGRRTAVVGYGNQGRAHALNLRDSGLDVVVGARSDGAGARAAAADGFAVAEPVHAALGSDLVAVLLPDEVQRDFIATFVERHLAFASAGHPRGRERLLVFAHGFTLRFDPPPLPAPWDVAVVAPASPGVQVRARYVDGGGVPAVLAVHQDGSGQGDARARAYAAAIGCARAGVFVGTVAQEAEVDLFGEQAVLCGGMNGLLQAAFDTLVEAGYPEELAYVECVQQLRLTAELVERFGVRGMRERISPTALFGDRTRGPRVVDAHVRAELAEILEEVRDGRFAAEWRARVDRDPAWAGRAAIPSGAPEERLERAGATVRGLFRSSPRRAGEPGVEGGG